MSQKRASAVATYLINRGIAASRISAAGVGPSYPIASNSTAAGREQNRRVEISIIQIQ
ncbi:MAG: OmpA family protein [Alphaproteobacteria bacterium]|nr:OmpA family protein [Alphaproteobacteria bacterium]